MKQTDRYRKVAGHPLGKRIIEAIGDDPYEEVARKVQIAGGKASGPAVQKWVAKDGNITEPNIIALCMAYRVNPAWLRYGVGPKDVSDEGERGIVESLPGELQQEALDFISYLVDRKGAPLMGSRFASYMAMIERITANMKKRKNGQ